MRVLLDTNILIHREAATVVRGDIGRLFFWLDKLKCDKCVHPVSLEEIEKHRDPRVRSTFETKLQSYQVLKSSAPVSPEIQRISGNDETENDRNDTLIVNELYADRVDFLISEDRGLHRKAAALGVSDRIFTIDAFLEKSMSENPEFADYKVLAVRKVFFGQVDIQLAFFDSFREEYGGESFNKWFNKKADEPAYVCFRGDELTAFLYLKTEGLGESYSEIEPTFKPKKRLKIGTLKVELNGYRIGERLLKIVFDNAVLQRVDEIYVTIFERSIGQERLVRLLEDFGFRRWGTKNNSCGGEAVFVRDMKPAFAPEDPKLTFPYVRRSSRAFLVPIKPVYHTTLLPDSILRNESSTDFVEHEPHRNAIRKVYVGRSIFRDLLKGDTIVFYRNGGYYKGVVTTLGVVDAVYRKIRDEAHFISLCRKRSVFSDDELRTQWNSKPKDRPFIVGFLYAYSFPKRPNLKELIDNGIVRDVESAPRGFEKISADQFSSILRLSKTDPRIVVD